MYLDIHVVYLKQQYEVLAEGDITPPPLQVTYKEFTIHLKLWQID